MPRLIPESWKTLEKIFIAYGFVFERQKGSHRSYAKDGCARPLIIPAYDEVAVFIIKTLMKTAGMDRETYFRLKNKV